MAEADMLDALYEEVVAFAARVQRGEAALSNRRVIMGPVEPASGKVSSVPSRASPDR